MLAEALQLAPQQLASERMDVLADILRDDVNLAIWQRNLPAHISEFAEGLLAQGDTLSVTRHIELDDPEQLVSLADLLPQYSDLPGHDAFLTDISWLVSAYASLLDAQRLGLRLRALDKAMCPRFHVDHVPVRLITSYAGVGSEWLAEEAMLRSELGNPQAEPVRPERINRALAGHVMMAKGERWVGNEGAGIIHRSPQPPAGERRLLLTLDWLA
ncbi:DUF1826 domain-containing protein [Ectopseudomonas mendocina]|uniref:DUF1826 domain-containing protein n=1 Tax=Ectopseudomonas mendocina TaxID=300 RepID=A0ABZ2RQY3_ECTME